jgi:hypothetical protein
MFITLSDYEKMLMADAEVMLTKNRIIDKVVKLFHHVYEFYQPVSEEYLPASMHQFNGKISKGEKYEALPYVVLDYPRLFSRENVFAVRTLFWWGNDMSITLHLSGSYLQQYGPSILSHIQSGVFDDWFIQTGGNEWQHAIREPYEAINSIKEYSTASMPFLKLAKKIPLQEWDVSDKKLVENFTVIVRMLSTYPVE